MALGEYFFFFASWHQQQLSALRSNVTDSKTYHAFADLWSDLFVLFYLWKSKIFTLLMDDNIINNYTDQDVWGVLIHFIKIYLLSIFLHYIIFCSSGSIVNSCLNQHMFCLVDNEHTLRSTHLHMLPELTMEDIGVERCRDMGLIESNIVFI